MNVNIDKKKLKILIPIAALVMLLIIAAIALFTRPNLEMDDITEPQKMSVLMKYGLPTDGITSDLWEYNRCIEFYDVTIDMVEIDFESEKITFITLDESDYDAIVDAIKHYADFKSSTVISETYAYEDIEIETSGNNGISINFKFY